MDLLRGRRAHLLGHSLTDFTAVRAATVDVYVMRRVDERWLTLALERGEGTRCTGAWECVHGRIEGGERPEDAALRELHEETGLTPERLYSTGVQPFYLPRMETVTLSVVFAAVVTFSEVTLGPEHVRAQWVTPDAAAHLFAWPRSRQALHDIAWLLRSGDAGAVEDVLLVRPTDG
jgi:dihydroneopterin triphosphate diphosphatase